ncbi:acyl-coenzyme A amino acid N-acyltransferase 1-like [Styela clava]
MLKIIAPSSSLADEIIAIKANGLKPHQKVTIQTQKANNNGQLFHAYAYYAANHNGFIDTSVDTSLGGSYSGVAEMGLFWAMKRPCHIEESFGNFSKFDVAPATVVLKIFNGFLEEKRIRSAHEIARTITLNRKRGYLPFPPPPLGCKCSIERRYNNENVKRIQINNSKIFGTLFLPCGNELYPGVLHLDALFGGVVEFRSSLLANHGFAVLALGYFNCGNRPEKLEIANLDYVEQAVDYLHKHKSVMKSGIGTVGSSAGGTLALAIASCSPKIKCVVNISGMLPWVKKREYKILKYAKTGHLILPPYIAPIIYAYHAVSPDKPTDFGGSVKYHAIAQEKSWKEVIHFLKTNQPSSEISTWKRYCFRIYLYNSSLHYHSQ